MLTTAKAVVRAMRLSLSVFRWCYMFAPASFVACLRRRRSVYWQITRSTNNFPSDVPMTIIVTKGGKNATKIESTGFAKEDALQRYIYDNPESIPLYDVKDEIRLLVLAREFPTASGPIDAIGFDRDGDIYCIETKLYKNADKRHVVAQVLDYGASLWHSYAEFGDFVRALEAELSKTNTGPLAHRLREFFCLKEEEIDLLLESVRANFSEGRFKFVVLMDKVHDQLKDLIVFLNENSRFDIFAVQMDFYRHEAYEILIPNLFGAEVKKAVSGGSSQRQPWNEERFIDDMQKNLQPAYQGAVRKVLEFAKTNAEDVGWGTGGKRGGFSPKFRKLADKSLFTVSANGLLTLNYKWLEHGGTKDQFKRRLDAISGFRTPNDAVDKFPGLLPENWAIEVDKFISVLDQLLSESAVIEKHL
jgi:hypothetical protein